MIGAGASHRRRGLDDVKPVHLGADAIGQGILIQLAPPVKLLHVADVAGAAGEKIGVQRQNHFGAVRAIYGVNVASKRQLPASARTVASRWLPLLPFRLRIEFQNILQLLRDAGDAIVPLKIRSPAPFTDLISAAMACAASKNA